MTANSSNGSLGIATAAAAVAICSGAGFVTGLMLSKKVKSTTKISCSRRSYDIPTTAQLRLDLQASFPLHLKLLMEDPLMKDMPQSVHEWIRRMAEYTVPFGKMTRGITVMSTAAALGGCKEDATTLGWCVEWLQACFLVADDIMDASHIRRDRPCWYKLDDVGLNGINDSFLLKSHIYRLIQLRLDGKSYAKRAEKLLTEVAFQTELGQLLDLTSQPPGVAGVDLSLFNEETYARIVKFKTAMYSFYLPIALGLCVSGVEDENVYDAARDVCVSLGEYFQIQDDYLDCYGDPAVIGKIGRDIEEKKCGWLAVQAVKVATDSQKKVMETHYGIDNAASVKIIKDLYKTLNLEKLYMDYSVKAYSDCKAAIRKFSKVPACAAIPTVVFEGLLTSIHKRSK